MGIIARRLVYNPRTQRPRNRQLEKRTNRLPKTGIGDAYSILPERVKSKREGPERYIFGCMFSTAVDIERITQRR